ncbi:hypothetical protein FVE85_4409 [Porphyridium purpureum]|uniref:MICOS complex subunit MIC60 n=1 Tax=Porphyridium purpureum TaxID=35688 RepID=A0A5J4YHN5_PORPP|nr:hypothetical protein FVE85_4409 [Porphyridium purpureum]|eukprot:POR5898..scf270_19
MLSSSSVEREGEGQERTQIVSTRPWKMRAVISAVGVLGVGVGLLAVRMKNDDAFRSDVENWAETYLPARAKDMVFNKLLELKDAMIAPGGERRDHGQTQEVQENASKTEGDEQHKQEDTVSGQMEAASKAALDHLLSLARQELDHASIFKEKLAAMVSTIESSRTDTGAAAPESQDDQDQLDAFVADFLSAPMASLTSSNSELARVQRDMVAAHEALAEKEKRARELRAQVSSMHAEIKSAKQRAHERDMAREREYVAVMANTIEDVTDTTDRYAVILEKELHDRIDAIAAEHERGLLLQKDSVLRELSHARAEHDRKEIERAVAERQAEYARTRAARQEQFELDMQTLEHELEQRGAVVKDGYAVRQQLALANRMEALAQRLAAQAEAGGEIGALLAQLESCLRMAERSDVLALDTSNMVAALHELQRETRIHSWEQLTTAFQSVCIEVRKVALVPPVPGANGVWTYALAWVVYKLKAPLAPEVVVPKSDAQVSPDAVLLRAQYYMKHGQLGACISELETLDPRSAARVLCSEWIDHAKQRLRASLAAEVLVAEAALLQQI